MKNFSLLFGLALFCGGLFTGQIYEHTLMERRLQIQKLASIAQHYHDWSRFASHVREDSRKFGEKSLLFPSDDDLNSLKEISASENSSLRVFQSPIDYSVDTTKYIFKQMATAFPHPQKKGVKLVQTGDPDKKNGKAQYRLRMTIFNPEASPQTIKEIQIESQDNEKFSPYELRTSMADTSIPQNGINTFECRFSIPEGETPAILHISCGHDAAVLPIEIMVYQQI